MVREETENDLEKLEKHAILEVMLGQLWGRKYTNNKFPYLSEKFTKLSVEDQETVKEIYRKNYINYLAAKQRFYQKNKH